MYTCVHRCSYQSFNFKIWEGYTRSDFHCASTFFSTIKYGKMSFNKYVQKVVERSADRFRHCADAFRSIFNGEFRIGSVISGWCNVVGPKCKKQEVIWTMLLGFFQLLLRMNSWKWLENGWKIAYSPLTGWKMLKKYVVLQSKVTYLYFNGKQILRYW